MFRFPAMRLIRSCLRPIATAAVAVAALQAGAEVSWHADLQAAKTAARDSRKPVLALFTAAWVETEADVAAQTLSHPEAAALVDACFEPVKVDVEAHPELARSLGVSRVPAACILAADGRLLTAFECPADPAAFVATAGRAAQEAAVANATPATDALAGALAEKRAEATDLGAAGGFADPKPDANRGSISLLTEKVRHLSTFADGSGARSEAAVAPRTEEQATATAPAQTAPQLPATPPAWPARQPAAAPDAVPPQQTTHRLVIEPAPATPGATVADAASPSWLDPTRPATAPAAASESSATISDAPAAPPKSAASSFLAALQKPFSIFSRSPAAAPPPAAPTTMPPARPVSPASATTPLAGTETDTVGSMPLGLEGYCPVTLVQKSVWAEGRAQWGVRHRGRTYLFAGAEQQAAFLANPDRYAPALSGDDPVLAFEGGKSAPGRRNFGVTYQSRMYLFASPETRATFTADPDRYVTRVDLAEGRSPAAAGSRTF